MRRENWRTECQVTENNILTIHFKQMDLEFFDLKMKRTTQERA